MEQPKKDQGIPCCGDNAGVLRQQLEGAQRFVLEILETTPPSRPVDLSGPPLPPNNNNNNPLAAQLAGIWHRSFRDEDNEALALGQPRAQKERTRDLWDMLSAELRENRTVAFAAFVGEHAGLEDLPVAFHYDREFLFEAVEKNFRLWFRLPSVFQLEGDFLEHLSIRTDHMAAKAFEQHPVLRGNRQLWEQQMIPRLLPKSEGWSTIIHDHREGIEPGSKGCTLMHAPSNIRADYKLMIEACSKRAAELGRVEMSLLMNEDFVKQIIKIKPLGMIFLPQEVLTAFPDLVEKALPKFFEADAEPPHRFCSEILAAKLGPELLHRPTFAKAWFCSGGMFYPDHFPEEWKDREDIFLLIAEHYSKPAKDQFQHATDRLKGKLDFMIRATEYDASIFEVAADAIKGDYELVVRYTSSRNHAGRYVNRDDSAEWRAEIENLKTRLHDDLRTYKRFIAFFLRPLSGFESTWQQHCPVSLLNQGSETTLAYKKLMAEYLGIPTGKKFNYYLKAYCFVSDVLDGN